MAKVHSRNMFRWMGVVASAAMWLIESVLHFALFDRGSAFELIPGDPNEFWMRSSICTFVILAGFFVQWHVNSLLDIEQEKLHTLKATMRTVQDIVGNALNHLSLVRVEAEKAGALNQQSLVEIDQIIADTSERLGKLTTIERVRVKELSGGVEVLDTGSRDRPKA